MCRLLGYTGPAMVMADILIKPNNSLVSQTRTGQGYHPGEQGARQEVDGDGFGVGWYPRHLQPNATRFVSVHPAWNDANLRHLAAHICSPLFLAHVRAASGTPVQRTNCHPFAFENWLFQHNGSVPGFTQVKRRLVLDVDPGFFPHIEGSTDSELLFHLALTFGLQDDPQGAMERMVGHEIGRAHV